MLRPEGARSPGVGSAAGRHEARTVTEAPGCFPEAEPELLLPGAMRSPAAALVLTSLVLLEVSHSRLFTPPQLLDRRDWFHWWMSLILPVPRLSSLPAMFGLDLISFYVDSANMKPSYEKRS